jgi:hypothetical protein
VPKGTVTGIGEKNNTTKITVTETTTTETT